MSWSSAPGPKPAEASFLVALARQNGGRYAYVDLSAWHPGADVR